MFQKLIAHTQSARTGENDQQAAHMYIGRLIPTRYDMWRAYMLKWYQKVYVQRNNQIQVKSSTEKAQHISHKDK